ncbi:MAG: hypothetical protein ACRCU3_00215 [Eubacteriaceae bacterium]
MNNSQIATAIALRDLHCYSLDSINDRILLQKKIFLAQDIGLPLGYGYSWYIHGPYSTDLTTVAYQVIPEGSDAIEKNSLKEPYSTMIEKVNAIEDKIQELGLQISTVQWYELVASIAYWHKNGYNTEEQAIEKLQQTKPQFSEQQVIAAYRTYLDFKLVA